MKKSIPVRILTALSGMALLALAVGVAAQGFFAVPVLESAVVLVTSSRVLAVLAKIMLVLVLAVLAGAAIVCALPSRRAKPSDYVMQRGENGPIGIAVKAIEKKVLACVAKHEEITAAEVSVREVREGIVILLNVDQVSGVNIPLSVGLLQKQIRQYVTACTGVDVVEVRVMVENRTDVQVPSAFGVEDAVCPAPVRPVEEFRQEAQLPQEDHVEQIEQLVRSMQQPAVEEAAEEPEPIAEPVKEIEIPEQLPEVLPEVEELPVEPQEDDRPLHQRVFSAEEEPLVVPMPPEMTLEPQNEEPIAEEEPAEVDAPVTEAEPVEEAVEIPAEEVEEVPVEEDWNDASLQEAAEAVLAAPTMEAIAEESDEEDEILL